MWYLYKIFQLSIRVLFVMCADKFDKNTELHKTEEQVAALWTFVLLKYFVFYERLEGCVPFLYRGVTHKKWKKEKCWRDIGAWSYVNVSNCDFKLYQVCRKVSNYLSKYISHRCSRQIKEGAGCCCLCTVSVLIQMKQKIFVGNEKYTKPLAARPDYFRRK